ncbi:unnamed protein product [Paramecium primaurelia]|uniref:Uncharacterized protein n=1 Tax=Paramecium primaurelia TaxID=5886 RepID=A0A8S1LXZ2_PARPR|nr:unnamed protein product [Paramecium primaurelia]
MLKKKCLEKLKILICGVVLGFFNKEQQYILQYQIKYFKLFFLMDNNYQANNSKCKCCKGIVKQQILNQPKFKIEEQITYECQPMLNRHQQCNQFCLNFTKRISVPKEIHLQFPKVQPMSLRESKLFVLKLVDLNQEIKENKKNEENQKIEKKKSIQNCLSSNLSGKKINFRALKIKVQDKCDSCHFFYYSFSSEKNLIHLKIIKQKKQLRITRFQQEWLLQQASFQSNRILFNAKSFLFAFKEHFPNQNVSISQFRKILLTLNIRYRIPSLKPFQFFNKDGKREEMKNFISLICGYVQQKYKLIFIDVFLRKYIKKFSQTMASYMNIQRNDIKNFQLYIFNWIIR